MCGKGFCATASFVHLAPGSERNTYFVFPICIVILSEPQGKADSRNSGFKMSEMCICEVLFVLETQILSKY